MPRCSSGVVPRATANARSSCRERRWMMRRRLVCARWWRTAGDGWRPISVACPSHALLSGREPLQRTRASTRRRWACVRYVFVLCRQRGLHDDPGGAFDGGGLRIHDQVIVGGLFLLHLVEAFEVAGALAVGLLDRS